GIVHRGLLLVVDTMPPGDPVGQSAWSCESETLIGIKGLPRHQSQESSSELESPMSQAQRSAFVPPDAVLHDLLAALDRAAAASLAGGIIAASGESHTPAQALAVQQDVLRTMFTPRR